MPEPIGQHDLSKLLGNPALAAPRLPRAPEVGRGGDFKTALLNSLEEVNRLQTEAAEGVERLATGDAANMAEVFSAVRKADIAFSMMMEMRNKLVEAYRELQQMRV
jgi:flagellar hook-basal body complex protein FliE